jgi:hypothetical protein
VARARKIDEEERTLRKRQQEERERFREKQLELQRKLEEEKMRKIEMSAKAREEYKEKMRAATVIEEPDESKTKKGNFIFLATFIEVLFSKNSRLYYLPISKTFIPLDSLGLHCNL